VARSAQPQAILQLIGAVMVRIGACVVFAMFLATTAATLAQEPACSEGSPEPITFKSWTTTPAPEHGDDAVRIDYVLTNNLDVDLYDFVASATYWSEGQEVLYHSLYNDVSPIFPAGGDINGSVIARGGKTLYVAENPSLVTIIACTSMVIKTDESRVEY
jgi:hypothetical protein